MATAKLTFPDGTTAQFEGSDEEVSRMVRAATAARAETSLGTGGARETSLRAAKTRRKARPSPRPAPAGAEPTPSIDLHSIVNEIKTSDEAEAIEKNILDRTSSVDRVLLPLYILERLGSKASLTTGEVSKVLSELGVPIHSSNVSHTISGTASKYVAGDRVRRPGLPVRYKLNRRGLKYMEGVLKGAENGG